MAVTRVLVVLAVALATLVATPALALVSLDAPGEFSASGELCLTGLPSIRGVPAPGGVRVIAAGEEMEGSMTSSPGWEALEGAAVAVAITREISLFDFTTKTFSGHLTGEMAITTVDQQVLTGRLAGTISGAFADPDSIIATIYESVIDVTWEVHGGSTVALGRASALFTWDPEAGSFCGPVEVSGVVH